MGGSALPTGVTDKTTVSQLQKQYGSMTLADLQKKYGAAVPATPPTMNWQFPQYSQTWAFTPPTPPPYTMPPPFDAKAAAKASSSGSGSSGNAGGKLGYKPSWDADNQYYNGPTAFDW